MKMQPFTVKEPSGQHRKMRVLVFYGGQRANSHRDALLAWLRGPAIGVDARLTREFPPHTSGTIDDRVSDAISWADCAVALLTPDTRGASGAPNVLDEVGRWRGVLERQRFLCIVRQSSTVIPSNLSGLIYVGFTRKIKEAYEGIREFFFSVCEAKSAPVTSTSITSDPLSAKSPVRPAPDETSAKLASPTCPPRQMAPGDKQLTTPPRTNQQQGEALTQTIAKLLDVILEYTARPDKQEDGEASRQIIRLYFTLEELLERATALHESVERYIDEFRVLQHDTDFMIRMREHTKLLLQTLTRFEDHLKSVFARLKVIGQGELCIKLSRIPESSYSLFKKHFVNELAPRFVAGKDAGRYVLRVAVHKGGEELVNVDKLGQASLDLSALFESRQLDYELFDFTDPDNTARLSHESRASLVTLKRVTDELGQAIRDNIDIQSLLRSI